MTRFAESSRKVLATAVCVLVFAPGCDKVFEPIGAMAGRHDVDYFPVADGAMWVYSGPGGAVDSIIVTQPSPTDSTFFMRGRGAVLPSGTRQFRKTLRDYWVFVEMLGACTPGGSGDWFPYYMVPASTKYWDLGDGASRMATWGCGLMTGYLRDETADVTVPAGTFRDCAVCTQSALSSHSVIYLAPGVGVVKVEGSTGTYELVQYDIR